MDNNANTNPITPNTPTPPTPPEPVAAPQPTPDTQPTPTSIQPTPEPAPQPALPLTPERSESTIQPSSTIPASQTDFTQMVEPTPSALKPKSKKLPLIIGASATAALLVGGAVAFAIYRTQPEVVALDAISGLLSAKNITATGSIDITNISNDADDNSSTFGIKSLVVNLDSKTSGANNLTEATATVATNDGSTVSLNFGEAFMDDGKLYLKVGGIKDAINSLPQEFADSVGQYLGNIVDRIDGIWWEISLNDILEASKDTIPEDTAKQIQAVYDCGLKAMDEARSSDELANLYKDHRFIKVANYSGSDVQSNGGALYAISLDNNELANFAKGIGDTNIVNNFTTCSNSIEGISSELNIDDTLKDINADSFKSLSDNLPELVLEANPWTHSLDGFYVRYAGRESQKEYGEWGDYTTIPAIPAVAADFNFNYSPISVSAPDGNKSILELTDFVEPIGGNPSLFLLLVPGVGFATSSALEVSQPTVTDSISVDTSDDTSTINDTDDYYDDSEFTDEEAEIWEED